MMIRRKSIIRRASHSDYVELGQTVVSSRLLGEVEAQIILEIQTTFLPLHKNLLGFL